MAESELKCPDVNAPVDCLDECVFLHTAHKAQKIIQSELEELKRDISAYCGNPDSAEACRNILALIGDSK